MTREGFIKKWLGNKNFQYCEEHKELMREDLDSVIDYHQQQVKSVDLADVVVSLPSDSREFKEWQERNDIERLKGTNDYVWGGFIYKREFFLEKFMEAQNKAN